MACKKIVNWDSVTPLFGKVSDRELARTLGVNKSSVMKRRHAAGISPILQPKIDWTKIQNLGKVPDSQIAKRLGVHNATVAHHRRKLGIPAMYSLPYINWDEQPFGKFTDQHIADLLGCSLTRAVVERKKRGIKPSAMRYRTVEGEAAYYGEAIIDAWLHKNNIKHEFQKKIGGRKVDWFLTETQEIWEYAGFLGHQIHGAKYKKQLETRIAIVQSYGLTTRIITENELKDFAENIDLTSLYRRATFECLNCKQTGVPHRKLGLCGKCYYRRIHYGKDE